MQHLTGLMEAGDEFAEALISVVNGNMLLVVLMLSFYAFLLLSRGSSRPILLLRNN